NASVTFTLQVAGPAGTPTAGVSVWLSFRSTGLTHGTVLANGVPVTSSPRALTTGLDGQVHLVYTAPTSPPPAGVDSVLAASSSGTTSAVTNMTSYAFQKGYATLSIGDVSQVDGDAHPDVMAEFDVALSAPQPVSVTVQYVTICGVGDKGCKEDYLQTLPTTPRSITIPAGQVHGTISVRVYSYSAPERYSETYFVQLLNPIGAILGRSVGDGVIIDDDESTLAEVLYVGDVGAVR